MDSTYQLLKRSLSVSQLKQETTLHNIANLNTANYRAKKVSWNQTFNSMLASTNESHISLGEKNIEAKRTGIVDKNNNDVDLSEEMIDLTTNQLFYNGLIQTTNKKIAIKRYVINGGN